MSTINLFKSGINHAFKSQRLILLIYTLQLLLVSTIGLQVYQVIDASIGQSVSSEGLINGFNFTVLQDLINVHGASLSPLIGQLRWYVLTYLIISAFIHGGTLHALKEAKNLWSNFWTGGAMYFWRFLCYGLLFTFLGVLFILVLFLPYAVSFMSMLENWISERAILWLLYGLCVLCFIGLTILFAASMHTRLIFMNEGLGFWKSIYMGFKRLFTDFKRSIGVLVLFFLLVAMVYTANFSLEKYIGIKSEFLILAFILIQQLIVYFKIGIRLAVYSSFIKINS